MNDYVAVMIALMLGFGYLFIRQSRKYANRLIVGWIGYALIAMSVLLIIIVVLTFFSQSSHQYGH